MAHKLTILPIDETSKRPMKELKRVSPELGKVMCVDGKHFLLIRITGLGE